MTPLLTATFPALETAARPEDMRPGAWAFVIVSGLLIFTVLLWFSLRKQLRRIDVPYADEAQETGEIGEAPDAEGSDAGSDD